MGRLYLPRLFNVCLTLAFTGSDGTFVFPADLQNFCPYTEFCSQNATMESKLQEGLVPCCRPCSCNTDCHADNNCCFDNATSIKECLITDVKNDEFYKIVTKCPNKSESCSKLKAASFGSFYPIYSPSKRNIYSNVHCAKCNNATDGIPWQFEASCDISNVDNRIFGSLAEEVQLLLKGNSSQQGRCYLRFLPPDNPDIKSEICGLGHDSIIRECNMSGEMKMIKPRLMSLCKSFNATFVEKKAGQMFTEYKTYANVYCFLCNSQQKMLEFLCPAAAMHPGVLKTVRPMYYLLTMTFSEEELSNQQHTKVEVTPLGMCRPHERFFILSGKCRRTFCPEGQLYLPHECKLLSERWTVLSFNIQVKLEPLTFEDLVPLSLLSALAKYELAAGDWLYRPFLQKWSFKFLYHIPDSENFISYFVIQLAYAPRQSVSFAKTLRSIKQALDHTWEIKLNNTIFQFNAEFSKTILYSDNQLNCSNRFLPIWERLPVQSDVMMSLNSSWYNTYSYMITMLFFCHQIELEPDEYEDFHYRIYFKVKDVYLEDGEFRRVAKDGNNDTIRVCTSVFDGLLKDNMITNTSPVEVDRRVFVMTLFPVISVLLAKTITDI